MSEWRECERACFCFMVTPRRGRQQSRDSLSRLLRFTDRIGLALVGAAVVAYVVFSPAKERNPLSKAKQLHQEQKLKQQQGRGEGQEREA